MIKQTIESDLKSAMLAGDRLVVDVLRTFKSVILDQEVKLGKREAGLSDEEVTVLLQKEVKKRVDAAELYKNAGDEERTKNELAEVEILKKYMPEMMSEEEITGLVKEVIATTSEPSMQKMGQIIGAVKAQTGTKADGAIIARIVKEELSR